MDQDKSLDIITLALIVVAVGVLSVFAYQNTRRLAQNQDQGGNLVVRDEPVSQPSAQPVVTKNTGSRITIATAARDGVNYQNAVKQYEDVTLQFDNCVMTKPLIGTTVKNGTVIMLDGRSPDPQIISLNGRKYDLNGYEYVIVKLNYTSLPQTISIDCETQGITQYNIGTVLVQR